MNAQRLLSGAIGLPTTLSPFTPQQDNATSDDFSDSADDLDIAQEYTGNNAPVNPNSTVQHFNPHQDQHTKQSQPNSQAQSKATSPASII